MIKYRYAYGEQDEIVDVKTLNREQELGTYKCIGCEKELIPRLGKKRTKHFAHKVDYDCSKETYLHFLAKKWFYNFYKTCLKNSIPYILEYSVHNYCNLYKKEFNVECDHGVQKREFNLISYFNEIVLEERDGSLIPDVRIYNPETNKSIYIEIAITHKSDLNKIESGNKIVEFIFNEEDDLKIFEDRRIPLEHEKIVRYNFKDETIKKNTCGGNCSVGHYTFIVFKSGKSILIDKNLSELLRKLKSKSIIHYEISKEGSYSFNFAEKVIEAHEKGISIRNCYLCRYHAHNQNVSESEKTIFCKFLKKPCGSNEAADCNFYKPDKKVYMDHLFPR